MLAWARGHPGWHGVLPWARGHPRGHSGHLQAWLHDVWCTGLLRVLSRGWGHTRGHAWEGRWLQAWQGRWLQAWLGGRALQGLLGLLARRLEAGHVGGHAGLGTRHGWGRSK